MTTRDPEMTGPDYAEPSLSWYCPECGGPRPHVDCDGCHFLTCSECSYPCACGDGEPEEPCAVRCGYVSSGRNLLEHQMHEHARCTECGRCPVGVHAVSHEPDCPRLQPGYQYPAPADYL